MTTLPENPGTEGDALLRSHELVGEPPQAPSAADERAVPRGKRLASQLLERAAANQVWITLGLLIALCTAIAVQQPLFLNSQNILNVLRQSSFIVIIAAAGTLVMVSGGIDISVAGIAALAGVVAAKVAITGVPMIVVILGAIAAGASVGLLNGVLSVGLRVTPIIATLGALYVSQGIAFIISGGQAVVIGIPPSFSGPGQSYVGPIPTPVVIAGGAVVFFYLLLHHTLLGKYTYAIGGNPETARLSGISVKRVQTTLYVLSGAAAGLSGLLLASRLGSGQPQADDSLIFNVIIAIVLGGTSLAGGAGTIAGTVIGGLFVSVLANGLDLIGVAPFYQYIALGTVLIVAALIDVTVKGEGGFTMKFVHRLRRTGGRTAF